MLDFSQSTYRISEDGTPVGMDITIVRTGKTNLRSTVTLALEEGTATGGDPLLEFGEDSEGNATVELVFPDDIDFDASIVERDAQVINTRTLSFASGQTSKTVFIPIADDTLREGNETFAIDLVDPSVGSTIGDRSTTEVTIIDNEGGEISGNVWHDWNADTFWNIGESGLSGWTVYIDENNNQELDGNERSTITDVSEFYAFPNLDASTYSIAQVLPDNWQQTAPSGNSSYQVSVAQNEQVHQINFGNTNSTLGRIQGSVWSDRDQNGFRNNEEPTLSGWTVYLDNNNNGIPDANEPTTITDQNGTYRFHGVAPGTYILRQVLQPDWQPTHPTPIVDGNSVYTLVVNPGETVTGFDFGNVNLVNPVAWWQLDDLAGTIATDSVDNNNGILQNNPTWINGKVNGALRFDGVDDFVTVTDDDALDVDNEDFTITTWFKFTNDGPGIMWDKRMPVSGDVRGYGLGHTNGHLVFQMDDGVNHERVQYFGDDLVIDGEWHHVAIAVDRDSPTGGTVYLDGVAVDTFDPTVVPGSLSNDQDMQLGRQSNNVSGFYQGALDEVQLFKTALTPEAVLTLYGAASQGNDMINNISLIQDSVTGSKPGVSATVAPTDPLLVSTTSNDTINSRVSSEIVGIGNVTGNGGDRVISDRVISANRIDPFAPMDNTSLEVSTTPFNPIISPIRVFPKDNSNTLIGT